MMTLLRKALNQYGMILLGLSIVLLLIWVKFLRERIPRDIPFKLKFYGLCILITICLTYLFIIKRLIKPISTNNNIVHYIIHILYMPLEAFDNAVKQYIDFNGIIYSQKDNLKYLIQDTKLFYFCFAIMPRLILVSILFLDVFIFHKLHYLYYFIFLTILLFLHRYIIHCLKCKKNTLIKDVALFTNDISTSYVEGIENFLEITQEDWDDPEFEGFPPPTYMSTVMRLHQFINFQTHFFVYHNYTAKFSFTMTHYFYPFFEKKYNITAKMDFKRYWDLVTQEKKHIFNSKINEILALSYIIEYYNMAHSNNEKFKQLKILIFANYFLCWLFILIISLPQTHWIDVVTCLCDTLSTEKNPFSNEEIFDHLMTYVITK